MNTDLERWQAYLDDELSDQERQAVEKECKEKPEQQKAFQEFQAEYQQTHALFSDIREKSLSFDAENSFQKLQPHLSFRPKASAPKWRWTGVPFGLATAALAVFLVVQLGSFEPTGDPLLIQVQTPRLAKDAGAKLPERPELKRPLHPTPPDKNASKSPKHRMHPYRLRIKGVSVQMLHQHKRHKNSTRTQKGAILHPGDFVQFAYNTTKSFHLMIISIDAKGKISRYVPLGEQSLLVKPGKGSIPKDEAIELDDALGMEYFLILTSNKHFKYKDVLKETKKALKVSKGAPKSIQFSKSHWKVQQITWIKKTKATSHPTRKR